VWPCQCCRTLDDGRSIHQGVMSARVPCEIPRTRPFKAIRAECCTGRKCEEGVGAWGEYEVQRSVQYLATCISKQLQSRTDRTNLGRRSFSRVSLKHGIHRGRPDRHIYMGLMLAACSPFGPCFVSKLTF
jgi:hypothetical protein